MPDCVDVVAVDVLISFFVEEVRSESFRVILCESKEVLLVKSRC